MKNLRGFVSAVLGGIAVSIGSVAHLLLKDQSPLIAAFMFGIGFLAVVVFDLNLFTDKSGYLFTVGRIDKNIIRIVGTLAGNTLGALICGFAFNTQVYDKASIVLQHNINDSYIHSFVGSLFCGVLIYIAIHGYRKVGGFTGCAMLITAASMIILCNFDYALLNVFVTSAGVHNLTSLIDNLLPILASILLSAIGNSLGAIIFASLYKFKEVKDDDTHHHHKHHHKHHKSSKTEENTEEAGF